MIKEQEKAQAKTEAMLKKHFSKVEEQKISNSWRYRSSDEIVEKMKDVFSDNQKFIQENEKEIKDYYDKKIKKDGEVVANRISLFWRCER